MLHTPLCDLVGIEVPIVQAGMSAATCAELVAAVSNAGALGSLGAGQWPFEHLRSQMALTRELTSRPFAVNFLVPVLDQQVFRAALQARPRVISFALGDPGDLVSMAHDAGALVMHQVTTVRQAGQAAERGVDIIIAQGSESGGFGGTVAMAILVPQVVDAVGPIPVVAAGGIADGRGLAAALVLGAQGVNIGTRFIASAESNAHESWKRAILAAESEDAVKVEFMDDVLPATPGAYYAVPRAIRTAFIDQWTQAQGQARPDRRALQGQVMSALQQGRVHELVPFAGQSAGAVREVLPAAEIVRRMASEAQEVLQRAARLSA